MKFVVNDSIDLSFGVIDKIDISFIIDGMPLKYEAIPEYVTNNCVYVEDMDALMLEYFDRYELWQFASYINNELFIHSSSLELDIR